MKEKINNVAVVMLNNIHYESFIHAVDIMIERGINVDIYVPSNDTDQGVKKMHDEVASRLEKENYNLKREKTDTYYDILFQTFHNEVSDLIKRKYTIKYNYGLTAKANFSLSPRVNYVFDGYLCYGSDDASCESNYGLTFPIGNIKYLKTKMSERNEEKKTILYLPTYGTDGSIELIAPKLKELEGKYNIMIKPHHGTEYMEDELETSRRKYLKENFKNLHSSKDSLESLMDRCDVVIADMSGVVFDAVCLKKPVLMYYKTENEQYGHYITLPVQLVKEEIILSVNDETISNLENIIEKTLSKEQIDKQLKLFNKLFCCENHETKERFIDFLDKIENGAFDKSYYEIHQNLKEEFDLLYNKSNHREILMNENKELNDKVFELKNQILELNLKIEKLTKEYNELINSSSWKITKPLRQLRGSLTKKDKSN